MLACCNVYILNALLIPPRANAAASTVVINEVSWAGTAASGNDEWLELYNNSDADVNLAGWVIDDDNGSQTYTIAAGTIAAKSYFLIEDTQETTNVVADSLAALSLANTGDKLVLKNASGEVADTVNSGGIMWFAGDATGFKSMERIDPSASGDVASNWANNTTGIGALDRAGATINGTPKAKNSVTGTPPPAQQNAKVILLPGTLTPDAGSDLSVQVKTENSTDLFSYGIDITYDKNVLQYTNATKGTFLSENEATTTSFQSGLENGSSGKVVAGESRLQESKTGISGNGLLFTVNFHVIGTGGNNSAITIEPTSFLANSSRDLISEFTNTAVSVSISVVNPVQSLTAAEGSNRYEIALTWLSPIDGATGYKILRKNTSGSFVEIGTTTALSFLDKDGLTNAGNIIPDYSYFYHVVAFKNGAESSPLEISGQDTRGIKGDNDRSDRVDGRDLYKLAQHFTETTADAGFAPLVDTTYDGVIDGSDLIDIGASWALVYS